MSTVHTDKSKVEISQNFVVFSEYMNFKVEFVRSVFGRNVSLKKSFRLCLTFRNMQEKLEKTISIICGCFYRVNTNTILLAQHCTVVKHHYLLKDTRSTLLNIKGQICKYFFMPLWVHLQIKPIQFTDFRTDDCIGESIKRKWSSGLFWADGAAEKNKIEGTPILKLAMVKRL